MKPEHKELGTIVSAREEASHGGKPNTVLIGWDGGGSYQAFGGLLLNKDDQRLSFMHAVMRAFGVKNFDDLVGKKCFALRSFPTLNEPIEGLMSVDTGRVMTIRQWRRHEGFEHPTRLEQKSDSLRNEIIAAQRRIFDCEERLMTLREDYIEWG